MGGYLGRARRRRPSLTVPTRDLQKRPSLRVHRVSRSLRVNSMDGCLNMADSLSLEDDEALADSQEQPGRVMVVHTQRYPVGKARDLLVGVFSSLFLIGQHNSVRTLMGSRMSRSLMILKVVSTKGRATLRFVLGQPVLIIWSFLTGYFSTQSRKKTRISALQEISKSKSKRIRAKKKKDPTTLGKGGEGFAKQEEDSPVINRPSDQGKDSDGSVSAPSAFRHLFVNGVLSSFVPRPGPLGRDICSKNSAKSCIKESQIAFKSSYKRNAIASSYSSSLAQWPPERIHVLATRGAAPIAISRAAAKGAAAGATRGAAPGAISGAAATGAAAGDTRDATPDDAAGAVRRVAPGAVSGAATGAAAGATGGVAPGAVSGAATGAAAGATRGVAPCAVPEAATGAAARVCATSSVPSAAVGAAAQATRGADPDDAADASRAAAARATPGAAPGAAADAALSATPGTASGAAADAASSDAPCTLPLASPDSSHLKEATDKGDEKDSASPYDGAKARRN
ncbi:myristoylated alanine-rich C-kinase substrate-like isoform X2 [Cricetulus griseus]|uniref:Myristoylated alanine-rich C-kinase substrate-like isoform X2 n=1 Tax=Cricetulus griseus TaxID=10029 RepID=A0A9J7KBS4_CRIGR|nr:myristoylated alanine-rich C-kinase substrate-like isoform X2 [Cricetulus griseus]